MKLTHTLLLSTLFIGSQPALANIDIVFDYGYDSSGYFTANSSSKSLLDAAASVFETRFADSLSAITSSGDNHFDAIFADPSTGGEITLADYSVAANQIVVFAGAYDLAGNTLGVGGPGGFGASGSSADFLNTVKSRGQTGALATTATDFGPWGGSLSFDSNSSFYFDSDPTTDESFSGFDFYSVAVHELGHLLGFGTAASFDSHIAGTDFTGPAVFALTGANQPLAASDDLAHWKDGLVFNGQETAMSPSIAENSRKRFTELDFAALADTGWEVSPVPEAETWGMLLAGLGVLGWRMRTRTRT